MSTLLFYENPIPLNSETHRNLKIKPSGEGLKFSDQANSVLLAGVEFGEASKHFPIVFANVAGDQLLSIAVLGVRSLENLFVDSGGRWKCDYVPAFIRRYPFVLAKSADGLNMTVCIDESYPGFGADEGQPLFNGKGESSEYLRQVVAFLQEYQTQLERTNIFIRTLREFDLLIEAGIQVSRPSGENFSTKGLMMVDEKRLQALPDNKIMQLFRSGMLDWIFSHLHSINNLDRMRRNAPAEVAAIPEKNPSTHATKSNAAEPALVKASPAPSKSHDQPHRSGKK